MPMINTGLMQCAIQSGLTREVQNKEQAKLIKNLVDSLVRDTLPFSPDHQTEVRNYSDHVILALEDHDMSDVEKLRFMILNRQILGALHDILYMLA